MVTTEYLHTLLKMKDWTARSNSNYVFELTTLALSDIHKSRNYFAAAFAAKLDFTHLLFVDADQGFHPRLVSKMLALDEPFVAALRPFRSMSMRRFHELSRRFDDPALVERLSLDFVAAHTIVGQSVDGAPPSFSVKDGFIRAKSVGAGVMLLKREVFERLREAYPELMTQPDQPPYNKLGIKDAVHQCFAPMQIENGNFVSEDIAFARRWDQIGGKIYVCVDEDVAHVGRKTYRSAYVDRMRHGLFQTE